MRGMSDLRAAIAAAEVRAAALQATLDADDPTRAARRLRRAVFALTCAAFVGGAFWGRNDVLNEEARSAAIEEAALTEKLAHESAALARCERVLDTAKTLTKMCNQQIASLPASGPRR